MTTETEELLRICALLPEDKRNEIMDFARFLIARLDDERWEALLASSQPRAKLDAFLRESAVEGETPLDVGRL